MDKFDEFRSDDCVFIDFHCEGSLKYCRVLIEGYIPNDYTKKVIEICCESIKNIEFNVSQEFYTDMAVNYRSGDDLKANEIYSVTYNEVERKFSLTSDMAKISIQCEVLHVSAK